MDSVSSFPRRLLAWYDAHRRALPWRLSPSHARRGRRLDPYHVLVSETMLQQTQVSTVIPYFERFIHRFPTVEDLARADEQEVLRLWQGLGYYSRARNLLRAARIIVDEHGGQIPNTVAELRALPGVGRYTAGAVASIAYDIPAGILDGNVIRVLCRLDAIEADPRQQAVRQRLWQRADEIVPADRPGDFNSALMELGATVCIPRKPQCLLCPVRENCRAHHAGLQDRIPVPKPTRVTPLHQRVVLCLTDSAGRWLIEQRPSTGRWAGMWQFITFERNGTAPHEHLANAGIGAGIDPGATEHLGQVRHALTHRRYIYEVYRCRSTTRTPLPRAPKGPAHPVRRWIRPGQLDRYPLPKPHLKIAAMLLAPRPRP